MDIYARKPCLSEEKVAEIMAGTSDDELLGRHARSLFSLVHETG